MTSFANIDFKQNLGETKAFKTGACLGPPMFVNTAPEFYLCYVSFRFELTQADLDGISLYIPTDVHVFLNKIHSSKFIPCNDTHIKEFIKAHGKDRSEQARMFTEKSIHLLKTASDVLNRLNIPFWLSSGNFLGEFLHYTFSNETSISFLLCQAPRKYPVKKFRPAVSQLCLNGNFCGMAQTTFKRRH